MRYLVVGGHRAGETARFRRAPQRVKMIIVKKGAHMGFKPNYNQQRAERDRAKRGKHEEKLLQQKERTEQRKAEREKSTSESQDEQN